MILLVIVYLWTTLQVAFSSDLDPKPELFSADLGFGDGYIRKADVGKMKNCSGTDIYRRHIFYGTGPFRFSAGMCLYIASIHFPHVTLSVMDQNSTLGAPSSFDYSEPVLAVVSVAKSPVSETKEYWFSYRRIDEKKQKKSEVTFKYSEWELDREDYDPAKSKKTYSLHETDDNGFWYCNNRSLFTRWKVGEMFPGCKHRGLTEVHHYGRERRSFTADCQAVAEPVPEGGFELKMKTTENENIQLKSDLFFKTIFCKKTCSLAIPRVNELIVTCSNDKQHHLYLVKNVNDWCPGASLKYVGTIAVIACRASSHPYVFAAFLIWVILGYLLITISGLLLYYTTLLMGVLYSSLKIKYLENKGNCLMCGQKVVGKKDERNHTERCSDLKCPYCCVKLTISELPRHAECCEQRKETQDRRIQELKENFKGNVRGIGFIFMSGTFKSITWFLVLVILLIVSISPAMATSELSEMEELEKKVFSEQEYERQMKEAKESFRLVPEKTDFFEEAEDQFELCNEDCIIEDSICTCPKGGKKKATGLRRGKRTIDDTAVVDLVVPTNWGMINVKKTFLASYSTRHIKLSWSTVEESGDEIILSGQSIAVMELEPHSGTSWELSNPKSSEKRQVTLSIYDFGQFYTTEREYFTFSRQVRTAMKGSCVGDCPEGCRESGRASKYEITKEWKNSRNWGCNPEWCLTFSGGCTCCRAQYYVKQPKWMASLWKTEYTETKVIACLEMTTKKRVCKVVGVGDQIAIDQIEVSFSQVTGVDLKLPKRIMAMNTVQDIEDHQHFTVEIPKYILLDPDVCQKENCKHGRIGDIQCNKPEELGEFRNCWGSWLGVELEYFCHFSNWPTCKGSGLEMDNTYKFDALNATSVHLVDEFVPLKVKLHEERGKTSLKLIVRPKSRAGSLTALISVNGLALKSKEQELKITDFKIISCKGCFGCMKGFKCTVKLASTMKTIVHLKSNDRSMEVVQNGVEADVDPEESEISGFSAVKIDNIKLCVQEFPETCAEQQINMEDPQDLLVERIGVVHTQQINTSCTESGFECMKKSGANFWQGFVDFLLYLAAMWDVIVYIAVVVVSVVVIIILVKIIKTLRNREQGFNPRKSNDNNTSVRKGGILRGIGGAIKRKNRVDEEALLKYA